MKQLCHELNREYGPDSIRVYVAEPGTVSTSILESSSLHWIIQYFVIVPVLYLVGFLVDILSFTSIALHFSQASLFLHSITFSRFNGATSLFHLSGLHNRYSNGLKQPSTDLQYASRHSWFRNQHCYVEKRPLFGSQELASIRKASIIEKLEELRFKLQPSEN